MEKILEKIINERKTNTEEMFLLNEFVAKNCNYLTFRVIDQTRSVTFNIRNFHCLMRTTHSFSHSSCSGSALWRRFRSFNFFAWREIKIHASSNVQNNSPSRLFAVSFSRVGLNFNLYELSSPSNESEAWQARDGNFLSSSIFVETFHNEIWTVESSTRCVLQRKRTLLAAF